MPKKKIPRKKQSVVPWKNRAEFLKVYEYAYSEDLVENRWAVEQIGVWETRCWPTLPCSVEATLLILRSKIQDKLYEACKTLCHAQEAEMLYSTAIVRFVNLLLENDQNASVKISISRLAEQRNIPPWIIECRHNISHGFSPTLPVLRMAAIAIMDHLEEIFWLPESQRVGNIVKKFNDTRMAELVQDYKEYKYKFVENRYVSVEDSFHSIQTRIHCYLSRLDTRRKFLNVLVRDFVTKEDVNAMCIPDNGFMNDEFLESCSLPKAVENFWSPMLEILHKYDSISTFLELLLLSQETHTVKIFHKFIDTFVIRVYELANPLFDVLIDSSFKRLFILRGANLNRYRLLYACLKGCSPYSSLVFKRLTQDLNLNDWTELLAEMLNIRQGNTLPNRPPKRRFDITFTVDDVEADMHEAYEDRNLKVKRNPWSLPPFDIDFSQLPLGHVFNPVDVTIKEEPMHEGESTSADNSEQMYASACEESQPVTDPEPSKFLFKDRPNLSSMVYRRKK